MEARSPFGEVPYPRIAEAIEHLEHRLGAIAAEWAAFEAAPSDARPEFCAPRCAKRRV